MTSEQFAEFMLNKASVAILPGTNFGRYGQGYVRLTYAAGIDKIKEGLKRMKQAMEPI